MHDALEVAPGVLRRVAGGQARYVGTAADLIACGLVELHMLPGQPGRPRGLTTYGPDGQPVSKGPHAGSRVGRVQIIGKKGQVGIYFEMALHLSEQRIAAIQAERLQELVWPFPATASVALASAPTVQEVVCHL